MSMLEEAERELRLAGWFTNESDYNGAIGTSVLELIRIFTAQGHSGYSAFITAHVFNRLVERKPLSPLTGEDDEWNEVGEGMYQNKRCSFVFKDSSGAYNIEGRVFRDPDGSMYTNHESRVYIEFPYDPGPPEIVDRKSDTE